VSAPFSLSSSSLRPDERSVDRAAESRGLRQQLEQAIRGNGLRLPLQRERLDRLGQDAAADEPLSRFTDQDLARLGRLLEAGCNVDRITCNERLAFAGDDLTRVDPDADSQLEAADCTPDLIGGPHCADRVVLVHPGKSEDGHGGVADELLDRAAVALEDHAQLGVVAAHGLAQELRVGTVAHRRRADEVAKEDRDRLADPCRFLSRERRSAGAAEAEALRVVLTAARTNEHGLSVRPVATCRGAAEEPISP
jgi:hypothetical protein